MNPQPIPAPLPRRRPRTVANPFRPRESFANLGRLYRDTQKKGTAAAARSTRRRPGNRYNPSPYSGDPDYTPEQFAFLKAVAAWRQASLKPFPAALDIFEVVLGMGYVLIPPGYTLAPIGEGEAPVPPLRVANLG
jgi:hypothetical protein